MRSIPIISQNRHFELVLPDAEQANETLILDYLRLLSCQIDEAIPECICSENVNTINNLEFRSIASSIVSLDHAQIYTNHRFLFLAPIGEHGYNFGQYRLASHLIKLGIPSENIELYPLRLNSNDFDLSYRDLLNFIISFNPDFICEIAYIGWENPMIELNKFLKKHVKSAILMGGPLTSSHTDFCLEHMLADVVFLGHGEYLFEYYLKAVFAEQSIFPEEVIPGVLYKSRKNVPRKPFINCCLDALYWDPSLMAKFCKLAPVINLFTSDVCYGNCIFCYRTSHLDNHKMSNRSIINKLELLLAHPALNKLPIKYVRFFDDDFFAVTERDVAFLDELKEVLHRHNLSVYELTFSVRSFLSVYRKQPDSFINSLKSLGLKRITVGADGFNDQDLKCLNKGYRIDRIFELANVVCDNCIPTLMYAILTTFTTDSNQLVESLENMIQLVCKGYIYIGPSITPVICVHSNNTKLYPSFLGEDFIYLDVHSVSKELKHNEHPSAVVMSASILPKNRLVRRILRAIGQPTKMESAYLIPILNRVFHALANEENFLMFLREHHTIILSRLRKTYQYYQSIFCRLKAGDIPPSRGATCSYINQLNDLQRRMVDINQYMDYCLHTEKIDQEIDSIHSITKNYYVLCSKLTQNRSDTSGALAGRLKALCPMPLIIYQNYCKNNATFPSIQNELELTKEECDIFGCL